MYVIDIGFAITLLIALFSMSSNRLMMYISVGYVIGMLLMLPNGYYKEVTIENRKRIMRIIAVTAAYISTGNLETAIKVAIANIACNIICDAAIRFVSAPCKGNMHVNMIITMAIGLSVCSGNSWCSYLLVGIMFGYMLSAIGAMVNESSYGRS